MLIKNIKCYWHLLKMKINIDTWTNGREVSFCPKHFISTSTELTEESKFWVLERLHGRYHISMITVSNIFHHQVNIHFEDPQEAVLYELTWS